ncbi:uncharacterized protein EAF01_002272 [Botrytis porri]|uniref:uncharacterized protein n=1 Tax=Botrytis porri TaxID=87229 RepID=UPI0019022C50|nr:uncharacterized protein EAF01_002272 [Botrytis porri]KAF7910763.1 hypothetical protein EAF01_002272 [Botrytis porri]
MSNNNLDNLVPGVKPALFDLRKEQVSQQPSLTQILSQGPTLGNGPATQPPAETMMGGFFGSGSAMATPQQDTQAMPPNQQGNNAAVAFGAGMPAFGASMPTFGNGFGNESKSDSSFKFSISHMVPKSIDHGTLKQENTDLHLKLEEANKELAWIKQQHESKEKEVDDLESSNFVFQMDIGALKDDVDRLNQQTEEAKEKIAKLEAELVISESSCEFLEDQIRESGMAPGYPDQPSENELLARDLEILDLKENIDKLHDELKNTRGTADKEFNRLRGVIAGQENALQSMNAEKIDVQVALTDKTTAVNLVNQHNSTILQLRASIQDLISQHEKEKSDAEIKFNQHIGEKTKLEQDLNQLQQEYESVKFNADTIAKERDSAVAGQAQAVNERDVAVAGQAQAVKERDVAAAGEAQAVKERDVAVASEAQTVKEKDVAVASEAQTVKEKDAAVSGAAKAASERVAAITRDVKKRHSAGSISNSIVNEEPRGSKSIIQKLEDDLTHSQQQVQTLTAEKAQLVDTMSHQSKIVERDHPALIKKTREVEELAVALQKLQKDHSATLKSMNRTIHSETSAHKKTSAQLESLKKEVLEQKARFRWMKCAIRVRDENAASGIEIPHCSQPCSPVLRPVQSAAEAQLDLEKILRDLFDPESERRLIDATRKAWGKTEEKSGQPIHDDETSATKESAEVASAEIPEILLSVPESTGKSVPVQESTAIDEQIPMQMVVEAPTSPTLALVPEFVAENFLAMERPEISEQTPIPVIVSKGKSLPRSKSYFWSKFFFIVLLTISWLALNGYFAASSTGSTTGVIRLIDAPRPAIIPIATMNAPIVATSTTFQLAVIPATASASASVQSPQVTTVAALSSYTDYFTPNFTAKRNHLPVPNRCQGQVSRYLGPFQHL